MICRASNPAQALCGQEGTPGIWTPVAFVHSDGCSARYCRQQHLGSQIPTITMGELGDPLFGVQLVAAVESWGQEPLALTQPLF